MPETLYLSMKIIEDRERITDYFKEVYGISEEAFRDVEFLETTKAIWMVPADMVKGENLPILGLKKVNFAGIRLLRKTGPQSYKPTTYGLQIIGRYATKNVIEIKRAELEVLLKEGRVEIKVNDLRGFVIVRYKGLVLGCGLLKDGVLYNQFPRGRSDAMARSGLF